MSYIQDARCLKDKPFVLSMLQYGEYSPILVAARTKAWVCGRSPAEIVGSNPAGYMDVCLLCVVR